MLVKQNTGGEYTGEGARAPCLLGGVACEGMYVGVSWEIVQGVFSAKGPSPGCHKRPTHPVLGLKSGSPIGGLWRVSLFSSSFAGNHTPSVMGDLVLERGLENPRKQPRVGARAYMPAASGVEGLRGPTAAPALSPSPGWARAEGGEQGPQPQLSPRVLRVGWRRGEERGSWPPTDTVNFGLKQ